MTRWNPRFPQQVTAHFKNSEERDRDDPDSHNYGWCWACNEHHAEEDEAERHQTAMTDWREIYKTLPPRMYRGFALRLSSGVHEHVHDESAPVRDRAQQLSQYLQDYHDLGTHWTVNQNQAEHYAGIHASQYAGGYAKRDPSVTQIIIHAGKPRLRHIERDPWELDEQGVLGFDQHDDEEIPMQRRAPVRVRGISWKRHDQQDWTHHMFRPGQDHTAAAGNRVPFDRLRPHEQRAVALYHQQMIEEGNAHSGSNPGDYLYESRQEPRDEFLRRYMDADDEFRSEYGPGDWEAHHQDTIARHPVPRYPAENRWPLIVSDANPNYVDDGYHRMHSYIRDGATHLPTIRMYPRASRTAAAYADGFDPRDHEYNGEPQVGGVYWQAPAQQAFKQEELGSAEPGPVMLEASRDRLHCGKQEELGEPQPGPIIPVPALSPIATSINGQQIDDHGDAPQHGLAHRAAEPNAYDNESTEGLGDSKWDDPVDAEDKKEFNGAQIGMYPEGVSAGGGPGIGVGGFVAARDERGDRWHAYQQQFRPDTVHRGIFVRLPDDLREYVHDESVPREDRAHTLAAHFSRDDLGMHWTPHINIAHRAIWNAADADADAHAGPYDNPEYNIDDRMEDHSYDPYGEDDEPEATHTDVMFHVKRPGERNRLRNRDELDRHQIGWNYSRDEDEMPLKPGTPLRLEGISWKPHEDQYPNEPFEHHDFERPMRFTSALEDDVFDALRSEPCERHLAGWIGACRKPTPNPPRPDPYMYGVYGVDAKYRLCDDCYNRSVQELANEAVDHTSRYTAARSNVVNGNSDMVGLAWQGSAGSGLARQGSAGSDARQVQGARVPWTDQERNRLHSWHDAPSATEGDFVPSSHFTNKLPEPPDNDEVAVMMTDPRAVTAAVNPAEEQHWREHLLREHRWSENLISRAYQNGHQLSWLHSELHRTSPAGVNHEHNDPREMDRALELHNRFGRPMFPDPKIRNPGQGGRTPERPDSAVRQSEPHDWGRNAPWFAKENSLAPEAIGPRAFLERIAADSKDKDADITIHLDGGDDDDDADGDDDGKDDSLDDSGSAEGAGPQSYLPPVQPGQAPPGAFAPPPASLEGLPPVTQAGTPSADRQLLPNETGMNAGKDVKDLQPGGDMAGSDDLDFADDDDGDEDARNHKDGQPPVPGSSGPDKAQQKEAALAAFELAASSPSFRWSITASWHDVVEKAKRMRREGGVKITHASKGMVIGEVRGDHATYESGVQGYPGRPQSVMAYICGCPWASFHEQQPKGLTRFAGRMCSHAYAIKLEAQSRGMFGATVAPDEKAPAHDVVVKSWPPYDGEPHRGRWREQWMAPSASRRTAAPADKFGRPWDHVNDAEDHSYEGEQGSVPGNRPRGMPEGETEPLRPDEPGLRSLSARESEYARHLREDHGWGASDIRDAVSPLSAMHRWCHDHGARHDHGVHLVLHYEDELYRQRNPKTGAYMQPSDDEAWLRSHLHHQHGISRANMAGSDVSKMRQYHDVQHEAGLPEHQHDNPEGVEGESHWPDVFRSGHGEDQAGQRGMGGGSRLMPFAPRFPSMGSLSDSDCYYRHEGPCPGNDGLPPREAASTFYPRPEGIRTVIEPLTDEERHAHAGYYPGDVPTHILRAALPSGRRAGYIHLRQSDDGRAIHVVMLHSNAGTRQGIASAMMDDLYDHARRTGAWIDHGGRTPKGANWWRSYKEPYPELNTHNAPPEAGWGQYFNPVDVAADMKDNWDEAQGRGHPQPPAEGDPRYEERRPDKSLWANADSVKSRASWRDFERETDGGTQSEREPYQEDPAHHYGRLLLAAGEDREAVGVLMAIAGLEVTADQANAPWGSNNYTEHLPQRPYGATSQPEKDRDPGSYGPLSGPDPDNWGEIQDGSFVQMPMGNEASLRHAELADSDKLIYRHLAEAHGESGYARNDPWDWHRRLHARGVPVEIPHKHRYPEPPEFGGRPDLHEASRIAASVPDPQVQERQESFPYQGNGGGQFDGMAPGDPQGIRMEESRFHTQVFRPEGYEDGGHFGHAVRHAAAQAAHLGRDMLVVPYHNAETGIPTLMVTNDFAHGVAKDHFRVGPGGRWSSYRRDDLGYHALRQVPGMHQIQEANNRNRRRDEGTDQIAGDREPEYDRDYRDYGRHQPPSEGSPDWGTAATYEAHDGPIDPVFGSLHRHSIPYVDADGYKAWLLDHLRAEHPETEIPAGAETDSLNWIHHGEHEPSSVPDSSFRMKRRPDDPIDPVFGKLDRNGNPSPATQWLLDHFSAEHPHLRPDPARDVDELNQAHLADHAANESEDDYDRSTYHDAETDTQESIGQPWANAYRGIPRGPDEPLDPVFGMLREAELAVLAALAEPEQPGGALAELKDEPEGALDADGLTGASDGTIGGGDAGAVGADAWGAASPAMLSSWGAYDPSRTPQVGSSAQQPDEATQSPGMGSWDEPSVPNDQSIMTIGQQQWSGGDFSGGDLSFSVEPHENPAEEEADHDEIVGQFHRSAAASQYAPGGASGDLRNDGDIAAAARAFLSKTADVLPAAEAQELLREGIGTRARNLDLLDIKGTHYEDAPEEIDDHDDDVAWA